MTGAELWKQYQDYTEDFTKHARTLGFGGAAVCWLFRDEDFTFPFLIYGALFFFVAYFVADMLQSLTGALTIRLFTEREEKKMWNATGSITGDIQKPRWVDWPAFTMFWAKATFLVFGFLAIGLELFLRLIAPVHNTAPIPVS